MAILRRSHGLHLSSFLRRSSNNQQRATSNCPLTSNPQLATSNRPNNPQPATSNQQPLATILIAVLLIICPIDLLAAQFTLTPRASVSEEYTDNVFLTEDNKEDDWITGVSVGLTAAMVEKTYGFSLAYDPQYRVYARSSYEDVWRHQGRFNSWWDLTRNSRIEISDRLLQTEDPISNENIAEIRTQQPEIGFDPTIRRTRNPYLRNDADIRFIHTYAERSFFNLGYNYGILRNDADADEGFEDNDRHTARAGVTHWFSARWGADANVAYETVDYEISDDRERLLGEVGIRRAFSKALIGFIRYSHSVVQYEGVTEDDKVYNPSAGIEYDITEDTNFLLDIGYFVNDFELRDDQSGFTLDSRLTKRFKRGSVAFSALGGYDFSFGSAEADLGLQQFAEVGVSGNYQFTRRVSGNLFGAYRYSDYLDSNPKREDEVVRGGAGISIQPLQWMTIGLNYQIRSVDSTTEENYVENKGILTVTLAPALPYRW